MQLDRYLEDLEAQFAFALSESEGSALLSEANFVRVACLDGARVELVVPIVGVDFVAGMALGANTFRIFPFVQIRQLTFHTVKGGRLETLRELHSDLREFLNRLNVPFEIQWSSRGELLRQQGIVVEVLEGLLRVQVAKSEHDIVVPLVSLAELQIDSVENSNDKFSTSPKF